MARSGFPLSGQLPARMQLPGIKAELPFFSRHNKLLGIVVFDDDVTLPFTNASPEASLTVAVSAFRNQLSGWSGNTKIVTKG